MPGQRDAGELFADDRDGEAMLIRPPDGRARQLVEPRLRHRSSTTGLTSICISVRIGSVIANRETVSIAVRMCPGIDMVVAMAMFESITIFVSIDMSVMTSATIGAPPSA